MNIFKKIKNFLFTRQPLVLKNEVKKIDTKDLNKKIKDLSQTK